MPRSSLTHHQSKNVLNQGPLPVLLVPEFLLPPLLPGGILGFQEKVQVTIPGTETADYNTVVLGREK